MVAGGSIEVWSKDAGQAARQDDRPVSLVPWTSQHAVDTITMGSEWALAWLAVTSCLLHTHHHASAA